MSNRQLYLILVAIYHVEGGYALEEAKKKAQQLIDMDTPSFGDE